MNRVQVVFDFKEEGKFDTVGNHDINANMIFYMKMKLSQTHALW